METKGYESSPIFNEYLNSLKSLTTSSKPTIVKLTQSAKNYKHASDLVILAIEKQLQEVDPNFKLPLIYLIDSIIKSENEVYPLGFTKNIHKLFVETYYAVNPTIQEKLIKVLETWKLGRLFTPDIIKGINRGIGNTHLDEGGEKKIERNVYDQKNTNFNRNPIAGEKRGNDTEYPTNRRRQASKEYSNINQGYNPDPRQHPHPGYQAQRPRYHSPLSNSNYDREEPIGRPPYNKYDMEEPINRPPYNNYNKPPRPHSNNLGYPPMRPQNNRYEHSIYTNNGDPFTHGPLPVNYDPRHYQPNPYEREAFGYNEPRPYPPPFYPNQPQYNYHNDPADYPPFDPNIDMNYEHPAPGPIYPQSNGPYNDPYDSSRMPQHPIDNEFGPSSMHLPHPHEIPINEFPSSYPMAPPPNISNINVLPISSSSVASSVNLDPNLLKSLLNSGILSLNKKSNATSLDPNPTSSATNLTDSISLSKSPSIATEVDLKPEVTVSLTQKDINSYHEGQHQKLYIKLPLQCKQCGLRYPSSDESQARLDEHMDWHFKLNRLRKDHSKKTIFRAWFSIDEDWIQDIDTIFDYSNEPVFFNQIHESTSQVFQQLEQMELIIPSDHEDKPCPICHEKFTSVWSDDKEDWIFKNAILVNNEVLHATCQADLHLKINNDATEKVNEISIDAEDENLEFANVV